MARSESIVKQLLRQAEAREQAPLEAWDPDIAKLYPVGMEVLCCRLKPDGKVMDAGIFMLIPREGAWSAIIKSKPLKRTWRGVGDTVLQALADLERAIKADLESAKKV